MFKSSSFSKQATLNNSSNSKVQTRPSSDLLKDKIKTPTPQTTHKKNILAKEISPISLSLCVCKRKQSHRGTYDMMET